MMVESFSVFLCKSLDFARHNFHFQVSVEVTVRMYQGALTILRSNLFWNRCIMSILLCLAQPQIWIPYVQTSFSICLYGSSLLWRDSEEFLPISQYIFLYQRPSSSCFFLTWVLTHINHRILHCHYVYCFVSICSNIFLSTVFWNNVIYGVQKKTACHTQNMWWYYCFVCPHLEALA